MRGSVVAVFLFGSFYGCAMFSGGWIILSFILTTLHDCIPLIMLLNVLDRVLGLVSEHSIRLLIKCRTLKVCSHC